MKLVIHSSLLILTCLCMACSPRITTETVRKTPAQTLSADAPVAVFTDRNTIPIDAQELGKVRVEDAGLSIKCDSSTIINLVKIEARKNGGNAVFVEEHIRPTIFSSCHQMKASILHIGDFTPPPTVASSSPVRQYAPKYVLYSTIPKLSISLSGGYGHRTAKIHPSLTGINREMAKKLSSGAVWDSSIGYHFHDFLGVGMTYSAYYSSVGLSGDPDGRGNITLLKHKDMMTYIGPSFLATYPFKKWVITASVGLGAMIYYSKETSFDNFYTSYGSTLGFSTIIGCEYKISDSFSLGLDLGTLSGSIKSFQINDNGIESTRTLEGDDRESLSQIRISAGIKYRFLKR